MLKGITICKGGMGPAELDELRGLAFFLKDLLWINA